MLDLMFIHLLRLFTYCMFGFTLGCSIQFGWTPIGTGLVIATGLVALVAVLTYPRKREREEGI